MCSGKEKSNCFEQITERKEAGFVFFGVQNAENAYHGLNFKFYECIIIL